jgi:hypothetical protein
MATQFCQKCKQSHPGRLCDFSDQGKCTETVDITPAQGDKDAVQATPPGQPEDWRKG